ncbi:hypothetical protein [Sorangium sp. So ce1097]|uniref:hypothetical protein n=1 Tax=Sorangium sp. So ce1097 TaxID=3133330 RepID=UPI003F641357
MGDENTTCCERCDVRAPEGQRFCAACRRAERPESAQDVLRELAHGPGVEPQQSTRQRGLTGRGLGCIIIVGVFAVAAVGVLMERPSGPAPSGATQAVTNAAAPAAAQPADLEADDVVRVLRALYPIGQAVAAADWDWSTCHDETVGFDALLSCAKAAHTKIRALQAKMPAATVASSACGKDIEQAHRAYIDGQERYHADVVAWLEQHRAALTPALRRRSLPDGACDAAQKACDAMPIDVASKYGAEHGASYARVNMIECTKQLFVCGSTDNVCYIGKVADRLGLGSDGAPRDGLLVRSTGRRLR